MLGFFLIGPTPLLRAENGLHTGQLMVSLVCFGVGESMSMTPVMDDMMHSCGGAQLPRDVGANARRTHRTHPHPRPHPTPQPRRDTTRPRPHLTPSPTRGTDSADAAVNSLSSLMASAFSLGQMIGPIVGSGERRNRHVTVGSGERRDADAPPPTVRRDPCAAWFVRRGV